MNERQEILDSRICKTINTIEDISFFMNNAECDFKNGVHLETFRQIMLDSSRRLAKASIQCREYYLTLSANRKKDQSVIDNKVSLTLNVSVDRIDYKEFSVYRLVLPILLPRKDGKASTCKDMWLNCVKACVEGYCRSHKGIKRLNNPGIAIIHRFNKYTDSNIIKDTDNYDVSFVVNILQAYFINDDRDASIYRCNIEDHKDNYTEVYVMEKRNLGLFITALHS